MHPGEAFHFQRQGQQIIVELTKICLNKVFTQFGNQMYADNNRIVAPDNNHCYIFLTWLRKNKQVLHVNVQETSTWASSRSG